MLLFDMMAPSLDIVIVNWNSGSDLDRCLKSIRNTRRQGFDLARVAVVDNASSDSSAEQLDYPELPLILIKNGENRGFAAACNQAATNSRADYLLFLNPDIVLFQDSLITPVQFVARAENADVGICGIQLVDGEGRLIRTCSHFPSVSRFYSKMLGLDGLFPRYFKGHLLEAHEHRESRDVEQLIGAFFLVRRTTFEALRGFDERFFVYFEDVDFSYRSYMAGWRSYYLSTAQAFHKGEGCTQQAKAARLFYSLRSRVLYGFKHFGWIAAGMLLLETVLLEPFPRLVLAAARGSSRGIRETIRGYLELWKTMPSLLWHLRGSEE